MGDRDDDQDEDIANNRGDIDSNDQDIANNRGDIDSNDTDIANNRRDIDSNDTDIAANRGDIDAIDEFVLTPGEAAASPSANAASASQRLRIHVPHIKTTLSMGAKAPGGSEREEDTGAPNYPGFGVDTLGHVFFDARGSAADSKMRLQSQGDMTLQTPKTFAAGGQSASILGSNGGTIIAGGGGTTIFGGAGLGWSDNEACDANAPTSPPWIASLADSATDYAAMWTAIDAAIALVMTGLGAKDTAKAVKSGEAGSIAGAVAAAGGLIGGLMSSYGIASGIEGLGLPSIGGTTVHGCTGLILSSNATAGLYSILGTCIASPLSVGILTTNASVIGLSNTELKGQNTNIAGWGELNMIGGATTVAARDGSAHLKLHGSKVFVGPSKPTDGGRQAATEHFNVIANKMVVIETKPASDWQMPIHTPGITIRTHGHLDMKSAKKTTIESHEAKEIEILLDQHNTIQMKDGETKVLVNDCLLTLKKGEGVTICQGTAGGVLATKSAVSVGFGSNMLEIKKSGSHKWNGKTLDLKGSTIKLG